MWSGERGERKIWKGEKKTERGEEEGRYRTAEAGMRGRNGRKDACMGKERGETKEEGENEGREDCRVEKLVIRNGRDELARKEEKRKISYGREMDKGRGSRTLTVWY